MDTLEALTAACRDFEVAPRSVTSIDPAIVDAALAVVSSSGHPDAMRPEGVVPYFRNYPWRPSRPGEQAMIPIRHLAYLKEVFAHVDPKR